MGCLAIHCLPCFSSSWVGLIARLHLCQTRDLMVFIQVALAIMVDIELVFHAYSAADRAKIDDGMKRHGIGALLLGQPSAQLIAKVCCICGLWFNDSIMHCIYQFILDKDGKRTPEFMPAFAAMHAFNPAAGPSPGGKRAAKPISLFKHALPATALLSNKPSVATASSCNASLSSFL